MKQDSIFIYYWHIDEKEEEITKIRAYGLDKNNKNICLIIDDFTPYVYLELPSFTQWNERKAQLLGNKLDEELREYGPIKKSLILKHKLYGAYIDSDGNRKKFPYLFCSFSHKNHITRYLIPKLRRSINVQGIGNIKMKVHEGDADPILQLVCCRNIPSVGWVKFVGEEVSPENKVTLADKEYQVSWKGLYKIENDSVGLPLIMGFDIEVNSCNPTSMPKAKNPGDKVFQISCIFNREGSSENENYLLTLAEADESQIGSNVKIICCSTEAKLLTEFTELVRKKNPNVIVGYNILGFDIEYMINRAKFNFCISSFDKIGFHLNYHSQEKKIKWSSSAYKNQEFSYLEAEGRIIVDLLPLIQRDYKFNNYTLKTVSQEILKDDTKVDLAISRMFKLYKIGTQVGKDGKYSKKSIKAMTIIGKYCIKDSELCIKLMQKMQTWIGLTEFAKTCIAEGEYITINNKSVPIETLINHKDILSWNDKNQGLIFNKQINFLDQGSKDCIKIYFENGTTLTCTEDHKILNKTGYWIEAGNLKVGERIKHGLQFPKQNILDDIKNCNNYDFHVGDYVYNTNNCEDYEKSLAFFRILGWLLTDGSNNLNIERARLYIGHKLDVETVLQDIYLLTKKNVKPYKEEHNFVIELPAILTKNINKCGIIRGKKSENSEKFLDFIMEENFPLPLLREFLGGLFGGDGHTLTWNSSLKNKYREFDTVKFTRSKIPSLEENLKKWFADLRILLLRFDIKTTINSYIRKKNISMVLTVLKEDCIKFYECISFRYSVHKIQKLFIGCPYFKYKTEIIRQRNWVIEKTKKYIQNGLDKESARLKACDDLIEIEPPINEYSIPTEKQMKCFLNPSRVVKSNRIKFSNNPIHILTFYNYLQNIDGLKFFNDENNNISYGVSKDSISIETINLKIIDIRKVGIKKVYDITVDNDHSFLANGIVCHNCNTGVFSLYTQGQQIKVFSQVYKYCLNNNIVVEKDGYVTKEGERYAGAHVFPPVPGIYDRVLPFDFCLAGNTLITLSNGLSRRIDSFENDESLLALNNHIDKFENFSFINGLQKKGIRETIKIYFQDGNYIVTTPEHKFMLDNGEWCQAKDLKNKYVKSSINFPEDKKCDLENKWSLPVEGCILTMKNKVEREKSLAFSRILGYIISDGSIYESRCQNGYIRKCCEASFGTMYDALSFKRDIKIFTDIDVTIRKIEFEDEERNKKGITLSITLPSIISKMIHSLEDIIVGKRSMQPMKLPKFILDDNCPLSIIREFLGGLFGGDGITSSLNSNNTISSINFKWTTIKKYIKEMNIIFIQLQKLLEKFNIMNTSIHKPEKVIYKEDSIKPKDFLINPRYDIQINLCLDNTYKFTDQIGFRFCINKHGKSYLAGLYLEMKEKTRLQRLKVLNRANELIDKNIVNVFSRKKGINFKDCLNISRQEFLDKEPSLYDISLSSNYDLTYDRHERKRHPDKPRKYSLHRKKFPSPKDYFKDIGVLEWFEIKKYLIKTDDINIPSLKKKIIDIRVYEPVEVYDIEVKTVHNFLANGVVAHNCSLYPTT